MAPLGRFHSFKTNPFSLFLPRYRRGALGPQTRGFLGVSRVLGSSPTQARTSVYNAAPSRTLTARGATLRVTGGCRGVSTHVAGPRVSCRVSLTRHSAKFPHCAVPSALSPQQQHCFSSTCQQRIAVVTRADMFYTFLC